MTNRAGSAFFMAMLVGAAVAQAPGPGPEAAPSPLPAIGHTQLGHFATSRVCAMCHSNASGATAMRDAEGQGIAPFDLWQGTMMANAARDPFWRAQVSVELARFPEASPAIEQKCLRCHSPMASTEVEHHGSGVMQMSLLHEDSQLGDLARDGASCTLCHQISPEGLGEDSSFSGQWEIGHDDRIFGPHASPQGMPMFRHTGFQATEGGQILDSGICAACHTLETHTLGASGEATGDVFLEQSPYVEWLASEFAREGEASFRSCQDCHMPTTDAAGRPIETRIVRNPGGRDFPFTSPRAPFGRHLLVGGNTLALSVLRDNSERLQPLASAAVLDTVIAATRDQLASRTARVSLEDARRDGDTLRVTAGVENLCGHKLPSGYPSRRAWLRVRVTDADSTVVFRAGEHDDRGRLLGADGEVLASEMAGGGVLPHRSRVDTPGQVVAYESLMADAEGEVTHVLMRAASFLKDTRLLPRGFDVEGEPGQRTAPVGTADDPDFGAGGDSVQLVLPASGRGPWRVEVTLLFQPWSARALAELLAHDTDEVEQLRGYVRGADTRPEILAHSETTIR